MSELTLAQLKSLLFYDPITGFFGWVARNSKFASRRKPGQKAGFINSSGYVEIEVLGKRYLAHRLAWFYVTGTWPENTIDHINFVRCDNRWENLQDIAQSENSSQKSEKKLSPAEHRKIGKKHYKRKKSGFSTYGKLQDPANPKYKRHYV